MALTISKMFSLIVFVALMIFFFFWIVSQVGDLGLVFGFRTSHTVANDIASLMSVISGIPGTVEVRYSIDPATSADQAFQYDVEISKKIVCVKSFLGDDSRFTMDCAAHPFSEVEEVSIESGSRGELCIELTKIPVEDGSLPRLEAGVC